MHLSVFQIANHHLVGRVYFHRGVSGGDREQRIERVRALPLQVSVRDQQETQESGHASKVWSFTLIYPVGLSQLRIIVIKCFITNIQSGFVSAVLDSVQGFSMPKECS